MSVQNSQRLDELDSAVGELARAAMLDGLVLALIAVLVVVLALAMRKAGLLPVRLLDLLPARG